MKINTSLKCKFKSSNEKIATVSKKGIVKGKKAGKAKVTVTAKSNKKLKRTLTFTVKAVKKTSPTTETTTKSTEKKDSKTEQATTEQATSEQTTTEESKKEVVSISAKYNGGPIATYTTVDFTLLDVIATFSDGSTKTLQLGEYSFSSNNYTLNPGNFDIEVSYEGKTAKFTVNAIELPEESMFFFYVTYDGSYETFEPSKVNVYVYYPKSPSIKLDNPPYIFEGIYTAKDGTKSYCYTYYYSNDVEYNGTIVHDFGYDSVLLPIK